MILPDVHVVIAGPVPNPGTKQAAAQAGNSVLHWQGMITSNEDLRALYCAADLVVVPSKEDNMPLTVMEALTTGTPVVGFNIGGLKDIITGPHSGVLAKAQDCDDLALGITKVLASRDKGQRREHVEIPWSPERVASEYISIYKQT